MKISLDEWNKRRDRPRSMKQIYRWIEAGKIYPPPVRVGREYEIESTAIYRNPTERGNLEPAKNNLISRIRDGSKKAIRRTA
ncbi:excisionase [Yersinia enterocolitica]|nr:excisionase [Yersinia enterocolitica]MBW5869535.1 excisionase [Yersinia enterocolitica]CNI93256.1 Excisionase-like protein [Yersinia frederiksenii]